MVVRPLSETGDFVPIYSLSQMVSGPEAVRQAVDLRLKFYHGEWWEDRDIGFRVPDFLVETARSGDVELLGKYIASYVASTHGVQAIEDVLTTFNGHTLEFSCMILTDTGISETVEVNINGLL